MSAQTPDIEANLEASNMLFAIGSGHLLRDVRAVYLDGTDDTHSPQEIEDMMRRLSVSYADSYTASVGDEFDHLEQSPVAINRPWQIAHLLMPALFLDHKRVRDLNEVARPPREPKSTRFLGRVSARIASLGKTEKPLFVPSPELDKQLGAKINESLSHPTNLGSARRQRVLLSAASHVIGQLNSEEAFLRDQRRRRLAQ